jgi:cytochrome c oxidase subunit 3
VLHPYHLVSPSPWPVLVSFQLLFLALSLVGWFHSFEFGGSLAALGLFFLTLSIYSWLRDVSRESAFFGSHPMEVLRSLKFGFIWFVISEIMLFSSLFWSFLFLGISPSIFIGSHWPILGSSFINSLGLPLFSTFILLSSSVSITSFHHLYIAGKTCCIPMLWATCTFGAFFSAFQFIEYLELPFSWSDGSFGGIFLITTGLHGIHVILGTLALITISPSLVNSFIIRDSNLNSATELSILYWHFVDYIWLLVFSLFYLWVF